MSPVDAPPQTRATLRDIAGLFFKLGSTAFGGPAAHIAMMEREVVQRRAWLTREKFLDYLGAANLIPGPNSTELAIHVGHAMAGWPGLIVAGVSFILPAALIVLAIAWAYVRFGALPQTAGILYGVKPVVIAVIAQALWALGRTALKSRVLWIVAALCVAGAALGVNELAILAAAGIGVAILRGVLPRGRALAAALGSATAGTVSVGLWPLFLAFAKIGAVLFGSGYVLVAFLRADFVDRLHWLTDRQLVDAIAVGQITPGPVFTTATFVGYVLAGTRGAGVATLGIFLPAFIFVALSGPLVPKLRRSPLAGALLDGVNVLSLALMAVAAAQIASTAVVDWLTAGMAVAAVALLIRYRVNSSWLVLGAAVVGLSVRR